MQAGISLYACSYLDLPAPNKVHLPTTDESWGQLWGFPTRNQKPFTGAYRASNGHSYPCFQ